MEEIKHQGVIEMVTPHFLRVKIEQVSACSACHVNGICLSADKKEKMVDVYAYEGTYQVGEVVDVIGSPRMGGKAVWFAYLLPLIVMLAALVISIEWLFPDREATAALISLGVLAVYYLALYLSREKMKKTLVFQVRHKTDDII